MVDWTKKADCLDAHRERRETYENVKDEEISTLDDDRAFCDECGEALIIVDQARKLYDCPNLCGRKYINNFLRA